jgi:hypothetical protein
MANRGLEARGHFLFSLTFRQPTITNPKQQQAKPIEQLRFLFSIGETTGNGTYLKHFWFDQKLPLNEFEALNMAKNDLIITWAQGMPFESRDIGREYGNLEDVIPSETSPGTLTVLTEGISTAAILNVSTRKGHRLLFFGMLSHFPTKTQTTKARDVTGVVYPGRRPDEPNLYLTRDPYELPFSLYPPLPKGVSLNPPPR